jgi:two-component system, response regulator YesN
VCCQINSFGKNDIALRRDRQMYKMIIVEDDDIERAGLAEVVDWKSMSIEVVGAFEGSSDALKYVMENSIDILLTDIKLFGMDGLELARKIKEYIPKIKVIISSAFQEFEYARTAIDLDAYGYISKPVDMRELRNIIEKVLGTFRNEEAVWQESQRLKQIVSKSLPLLKDRFFHNLVSGNIDPTEILESMEYFNIKMSNPGFLTIISDVDNFQEINEGKSKEEAHVLSFQILEILSGSGEKFPDADFITFQLDPGRYCTVVNHEFEDQKDLHEFTIR